MVVMGGRGPAAAVAGPLPPPVLAGAGRGGRPRIRVGPARRAALPGPAPGLAAARLLGCRAALGHYFGLRSTRMTLSPRRNILLMKRSCGRWREGCAWVEGRGRGYQRAAAAEAAGPGAMPPALRPACTRMAWPPLAHTLFTGLPPLAPLPGLGICRQAMARHRHVAPSGAASGGGSCPLLPDPDTSPPAAQAVTPRPTLPSLSPNITSAISCGWVGVWECVCARGNIRTSVQNSFTFSRIMLQCRSNALTRASSLRLLRQLISTWGLGRWAGGRGRGNPRRGGAPGAAAARQHPPGCSS